ncbi:MAG TPA: ADOP family duplicated permease [Gemmatimonadaceae bacterium]|nr:ADOP family duplicated permease [Gemmatimonadaceae bacterium]
MSASRRYARFWGRDIDGDIDDELRFHLESLISQYECRGATRAAAEQLARERFGDLVAVERALYAHDRAVHRYNTWRDAVQSLAEDLRIILRALRRAPAFSVTTIATLGLGIAATSAVFSVADTVLIRPLPIRAQDRVVALWATAPGAATEVPTILDRYERFRRSTTTLADVAGFAHYGTSLVPLQDRDVTRHAREAVVTGNFFAVLGAIPVRGRLLRREDDVIGAEPVIVISERYWRSEFGGDRTAVGRRVTILNREMTATIVGVAPAGLEYPNGADYWLPIVPTKYPAVDLVGRLRDRTTPNAARAELAVFIRNDARAFPTSLGARSLVASDAVVQPLSEVIIGSARRGLTVLVAAVVGLLLIACVNVSNLMLVRSTARAREMAVRRALGASSRRLALQLTVEVSVLALAGAVLGACVAELLLRILIAVAPAGVPRIDEVALSPAALAVATVATTMALLLSGVLPAVSSASPAIEALRSDSRAGTDSRHARSVRSALVAAQLALALVLLAGAGLLLRSLVHLEDANLGYDPTHLSIVQITAPFHKYGTPQQFNDAFDAAQRQMRSVPGVVAITPVLAWPFTGSNVFAARFDVRDRPALSSADAPYVSWDAVGPEFSKAFDASVVRGRGISAADRLGTPDVAVVTSDLANQYWPGENALGKQLRFAGTTSAGDTAWRTVVGVIKPLNYRSLRTPTPTVLLSYPQAFQQGIFAVRSRGELATLLPDLRRAAAASDHDIVLWRAQTMDDVLAGPLSRPRVEAFVLAVFAALALFLASVGVYGVVAFVVRAQTRELGIRIALGATRADVVRFALANSVRVALVGVALGGVLTLVGTGFLTSELFEVRRGDPAALAGAAAALLLGVAIGGYIPARRAAHIDPVRALASEG